MKFVGILVEIYVLFLYNVTTSLFLKGRQTLLPEAQCSRRGQIMTPLDKNSPVPLYYQLYTILLNKIREGELKPGDMLPTELVMVEAYGVSRATVRQAILDLARNGYVVREKSKGTFVKDFGHNVGYRDRIKGFTARSSRDDMIPLTTKVLEQGVVLPSKLVMEALRLSPGEKAFYLRRVRNIRGEPNTYVEDWLPYRICPGIEKNDFTNASLYQTLEAQHGLIPHHAVRTFECCFPDVEEQIRELRIRKSTPLLRCTSYVYDANDDPVEFYIAVVNGKYTVQE